MSEEHESRRLRWAVFYLQVVSLIVVAGGGILGYFLIKKVDTDLKAVLAEKARHELETPILGVTPVVHHGRGDVGINYLTIEVLLENLGFAPVHIGRVSIDVAQGTPEEDLRSLLSRGKTTEGSRHAAEDAEGAVFAIGSGDLDWTPVKGLNKELPLDFRLEKSQAGTVRFDYIVAESALPKWYRFLITVSPLGSDDGWQSRQVDVIVPGGGMPGVPYAIGKMVYETRIGSAPVMSSKSAPPIPFRVSP